MSFNNQELDNIRIEVLNHINNAIAADDFIVKKICIVGSRVISTHIDDSDLDIVIQFDGNIREDDLHQILNQPPLLINDITVDFIPYSERKGHIIDFTKTCILIYQADELDDEEVCYDKKRMLHYIKKGLLLQRVYKDLMERGHSEDDALKIVFNYYVLGDSVMECEYMTL